MSDKFRWVERIGSGKFGEVWRAIDRNLGAECAVKRIPRENVLNPANFFLEAQTLKLAEHPNIVEVKEADHLSDDSIYVSMEYLRRGSVQSEDDVGYVRTRTAVRVISDVLRGLSHAHSKGITHRDIKPSNILLTDTLDGKLSDFGLAMPRLSEFDRRLVNHHIYPTHLAPEVRYPEQYTPLADIFACGLTLYRLVNGDAYFEQGDYTRHREFVPVGLAKVIEKAISADPSQRYQSAKDMQYALDRVDVLVDWAEKEIEGGKQWTFVPTADYTAYEVERTITSSGLYNIVTRRGDVTKSLRRHKQLCHEGLTEKAAIQTTRKILQGFVSGKFRP